MAQTDFVALDVETANADRASICQIGLAAFRGAQLHQEWKSLVNPKDAFDPFNISIHGIDESSVEGSPTFAELADDLRIRLSGKVVVSHTGFDRVAVLRAYEKCQLVPPDCVWLDSASIARRTWPDVAERGYGLTDLCARLGHVYAAHDALEDAKAAAVVLLAALEESKLDLVGWRERLSARSRSSTGRIAVDGNPDGPLRGEVLVFTGELSLPRREAALMAARAGCAVEAGVTKSTTILVVGNQDARLGSWDKKSTKHRKAETLISKGQRIHILSELDFQRLVNQFTPGETDQ